MVIFVLSTWNQEDYW